MTITIAEYSILKAASVAPEIHMDLLDEPKEKKQVEIAIALADKGYLKNLGGISQEEYSFKITAKGQKAVEENEALRYA